VDACRNFVPLPKQITKEDVYEAEQDTSAGVGVRLRNRKRKYGNIPDMSWQVTLVSDGKSLDTETVIAGDNVVHLLPRSVKPYAVNTRVKTSSASANRQDSIVDYSSSSDEEELNCIDVPPTSTETTRSQGLPTDATEHIECGDFATSDSTVDYLSSSDDEELNSSNALSTSNKDTYSQALPTSATTCESVTKKRRIECRGFTAPDDGYKRETTSQQLKSSGERLMGKSDSKASDSYMCRTLDQAMAVLIELRSVISRLVARNVFPFNAQPLIRHLRRCEVMYAGSKDTV